MVDKKKNIINKSHYNRKDRIEAQKLLTIRRKEEKQKEYKEEQAKIREELDIISSKVRYDILDMYIEGYSLGEIGKKYHYHQDTIAKIIDDFYKKLINTKATKVLMNQISTDVATIPNVKTSETINQEFLDKLSDNFSENLSEEEAAFAWFLVHKGDSKDAIEESGLNVGLFKDSDATYSRGILTRSLYLQNKPNVSSYIRDLRLIKYQPSSVDKETIQELLIEEINKIRNQGIKGDTRTLSKYIELLGKTIGAFTERVEVHEVDPSKALDRLIEMAKDSTGTYSEGVSE